MHRKNKKYSNSLFTPIKIFYFRIQFDYKHNKDYGEDMLHFLQINNTEVMNILHRIQLEESIAF